MPFVSRRSLTPHGMPCSGPRYFPAAISASARLRLLERELGRERDDALELRVEAPQPVEVDPRQPLGGERLRLDPAREGRDGREGDVLVPRRAAGRERPCSARSGRARGPPSGRAARGSSARRARGDGSSATFFGPVRRSIVPAIASRQLPAACARSFGESVTRTSFSASAIVADVISGPTAARSRTRAAFRRRASAGGGGVWASAPAPDGEAARRRRRRRSGNPGGFSAWGLLYVEDESTTRSAPTRPRRRRRT